MTKAKKVVFDFSAIVDAAIAGAKAQGAFVRTIVEARAEMPNGVVPDVCVLECMAAIATLAAAEGLTKESMDVYYSKGKTLLTCDWQLLLDAVGSGYGINGVTSRIIAAKKEKADAPAKGVRGKSKAKAAPMVAASAAPAAGSEVSPMHRWNIVLNDMVAQALIVRDAKNQVMGVEDAKAVQAALMSVKAVIGKYL